MKINVTDTNSGKLVFHSYRQTKAVKPFLYLSQLRRNIYVCNLPKMTCKLWACPSISSIWLWIIHISFLDFFNLDMHLSENFPRNSMVWF